MKNLLKKIKNKSEPLQARKNVNFSYKKVANIFCEEKGSMTVEAVFTLPILLFAICGILSLGRVYSSMDKINHALQETGKTLALELEETSVNKNAVRRIFEGYLMEYPGNVRGVIRIDSVKYDTKAKEWKVNISYKIGIDLPLIGNYKIDCYDEIRQKDFQGFSYEDTVKDLGNYVYVAETESVYHTNGQCTYLNIRKIPILKEAVKTSGQVQCSHCKENETGSIVFITDTGNKYHTSLMCGSLNRKVRIVRQEEVRGMGMCSRCQKNGS